MNAEKQALAAARTGNGLDAGPAGDQEVGPAPESSDAGPGLEAEQNG